MAETQHAHTPTQAEQTPAATPSHNQPAHDPARLTASPIWADDAPTALQPPPQIDRPAPPRDPPPDPPPIQRTPLNGAVPEPETEEEIAALLREERGHGHPLPPALREQVEATVQAPLAQVQIHTDEAADRLSRNLGAQAFASGHDIFFRHGQFAPHSSAGLRLLVHEAAHVRQQEEGRTNGLPQSGALRINRPGDALEHEADRIAARPLTPAPAATAAPLALEPAPAPADEPVIQRNGEPRIVPPSRLDRDGFLEEVREAVSINWPELVPHTYYYIVTDQFYLYGPSGDQPLGTFRLGPQMPLPPGYYRETATEPLLRVLNEYEDGQREWLIPSWEDPAVARQMQFSSWMAEGEHERLQEILLQQMPILLSIMVVAPIIGGGGGGAGESERPEPPEWATEQDRAIQEALEQAQQAREATGEEPGAGGQGARGEGEGGGGESESDTTGAGGGETAGAGGGEGTGGRRPEDATGETSDTPDRVVMWVRETDGKPFLNVWADGAHKALPMREGESTEDLLDRVRDAARGLREARDPRRSERVADGATETGFQGAGQPTEGATEGVPASIEEAGVGEGGANAPAYPSRIINYGPDITVLGANNRFAMEIDYSPAGRDTLSQVAARMQRINFYWEIIDVTNVQREDQATMAREAPGEEGPGEQQTPGMAVEDELSRDMDNIGEDTRADIEDLAEADYLPWQARAAWLGVIGVSNIIQMGGSLISSLLSIVTTPRNEQSIGWDNRGDFLVRCIATPIAGEDAQVRRASSVAVHPIRVQRINERALEELNRIPAHLESLRKQFENTTDEEERQSLVQQISTIETAESENTLQATNRQLRLVREKLDTLDALETAIRNNTPTRERSPAVRLLLVQLELMNIPRPEYRRHLEQQRDALQSTRERIEERTEGFKPLTYRPRVVLASEENGMVTQMLMVLGEASDSSDGDWHYKLADVTSAATQDTYEGTSEQSGTAGRNEAIRQAFVDFRENNGYGRGTIAIRLPDMGFETTLEQTMRSAPGTRARVMQRLSDLALAAEIAGLVISGPVGVALGVVGGVAGAVVAADSLMRRHDAGRLRWDFQTVMDVISVIGGVVAVGQGATALARGAQRVSWISRVEEAERVRRIGNIERVERVLHLYSVSQMGSQVIIIPLSLQQELAQIDAQEGLSPGERDARRAEALLRAVRSGAVTVVSAAQMINQQAQQPPRRAQDAIADLESGGTRAQPSPGDEGARVPDTSGVDVPRTVEPEAGGAEPRRPTPEPEAGGAETPPRTTAPEAEAGGAETPPGGREPPTPTDGDGGGTGRGPSAADEPTLHAPERVESATADNWQQMLGRAMGRETVPYFGRIRIVDESLVSILWERARGGAIPDEAVGFRDPDANILYVSRARMTDALQQHMQAMMERRISRHARRTFGDALFRGYLDQALRGAIYDTQAAPEGTSPGKRLLATRLETVVGSTTLANAMFGAEIGLVHNALTERFGAARANAIEGALRAGHTADALLLLDPPNPALANAMGQAMAAGVADWMAQQMGRPPRNRARAALLDQIARRIGGDLLRDAYLRGNVEELNAALDNALGRANRLALADALREGNLQAAEQALNAPRPTGEAETTPRPADEAETAPRPTDEAETAPRPADEAETTPEAPDVQSDLPPLGMQGRALRDAVQAGASDLSGYARATIEEVGDFRRLRRMVEAGYFGTEGPIKTTIREALQAARNALIDEVLTGEGGIKETVEARHPGVTLELQDLGTPGFNSDRDVTLRATGGRDVNQDVAASVEAVRDAYAALRQRGLDPDQALDTNFYTELHEGRIEPADPAEAAAILHDQSVVSLVEMRLGMSAEQWAAYREAQMRSLGADEQASGMQGAIEAEARQRLAQQFAEAEALAGQLRPEGRPSADVLAERQQALLEALERGASPREIRQLMAQIKLLEPDAYGTRAAVEGVVGEQQRIARGTSRDYMEPGRELPEDRPARLAVLAQEASSSLAKMFGHAAGDTGNRAGNVRDMAKYLARIYHAFREAGLSASHPLLNQTGGVVGAKHETDSAAATMREVRAWGEDNNLSHLSDQQLRDRWVREAQALGQELVVRLRTSEQITGAVEGTPPPPPGRTGGDGGGGDDGSGGGGRSRYDGIEAREGIALGGDAHRLRIGEEDGQLVVKLCTDCRRLRQRFERIIGDPAMEGIPDVAREIERLHHQAGRLERDLNRNRITTEEAQQQCDDIAARLNDLAQEHPQALGPAVGIPRGFTDQAQLEQFGQIIRDHLEGLIFYVEAHIQGSSVRGHHWETGRPFGPHSDIDLAIVSEDLHDIAASAEQARGDRSEPNPRTLDDILDPIRQETSDLLGGREINIMIYRTRGAMEARGDSIQVPIYEHHTDTEE
jgi:hypothetical protein